MKNYLITNNSGEKIQSNPEEGRTKLISSEHYGHQGQSQDLKRREANHNRNIKYVNINMSFTHFKIHHYIANLLKFRISFACHENHLQLNQY